MQMYIFIYAQYYKVCSISYMYILEKLVLYKLLYILLYKLIRHIKCLKYLLIGFF